MTKKQITIYRAVSNFAGLAMLVFGAVAAFDWLGKVQLLDGVSLTQIFAGLATICGVISRWAAGALPSSRPALPPMGVLMLLVAVGMMWSACTSPNAAVWRTLDGVQQAKALTAKQLAAAGERKHRDCLATHGGGSDGYRECIEPTRKMLVHWTHDARPAIVAAVQITASALQIAERAQSEKKVDWIRLLKPAICALARVVKLYAHYMPDGGQGIKTVLSLAEGVTCGR